MKKLAIVTTHPIQYYAPIFRQLAARGNVQIKVFYTWPQSQQVKYDPGFGKAVRWDIPLLNGYDYAFIQNTAKNPGSHGFSGIQNPTLIREIAGWAPDALLVFSWSYRSNLAVLRHFKGKIPVFFRGDSHLLDEKPGLKTQLRRSLLRWVYRHVDYAFYVGENNRQYFLKHGLKTGQLLFAPHVVDNDRFGENVPAKEAEALAWRRRLDIPQDAVVLLYAAKLEPKKDPQLLLKAFVEMDQPAAYLIIVGNGPLEEALKAQFANHPRIRFLAFQNQSQMPLVYRLGQVFVLPSQGPAETWGLALNEAMACGRAVVASHKVGGALDLIKAGENGWVFRAGHRESLKSALGRLLQEPARIAAMGDASLQRIREWSIEKTVECLEQGVLRCEAARPEIVHRPGVLSNATS